MLLSQSCGLHYPTSTKTDTLYSCRYLFIYLVFTIFNCIDTFTAAALNFSVVFVYIFLLCAFQMLISITSEVKQSFIVQLYNNNKESFIHSYSKNFTVHACIERELHVPSSDLLYIIITLLLKTCFTMTQRIVLAL